jgi:hypothetical protein
MQTSDDGDILGGCYCGGVRFSIAAGTRPFRAGYCHCRDCRHAHAAPLYQYVYVEAPAFRIVAGEQLLKWFTRSTSKSEHFKRYFCECCGSKVYNMFRFEDDGKTIDLRGTFPSLFDDQDIATGQTWSPQVHIFCAESIMDLSLLQDGLPKLQTNRR